MLIIINHIYIINVISRPQRAMIKNRYSFSLSIQNWHATPDGNRVSHSVMSNSATTQTVACQAPLSVGFFRQEYWSGFLSSEDSDPGIEPRSSACRQILYHLSYRDSINMWGKPLFMGSTVSVSRNVAYPRVFSHEDAPHRLPVTRWIMASFTVKRTSERYFNNIIIQMRERSVKEIKGLLVTT